MGAVVVWWAYSALPPIEIMPNSGGDHPCPPVPTVLLHDYRGVVDGGFLSLAHETKRLFWPSANLQYMEKGPIIILVPIFLRIYSNDKRFR